MCVCVCLFISSLREISEAGNKHRQRNNTIEVTVHTTTTATTAGAATNETPTEPVHTTSDRHHKPKKHSNWSDRFKPHEPIDATFDLSLTQYYPTQNHNFIHFHTPGESTTHSPLSKASDSSNPKLPFHSTQRSSWPPSALTNDSPPLARSR